MLSIVVCFCFKDVPTFFEPWAGFSPAFFAPDLFWVQFFARRRKLTVPRWSIRNFWMLEAGTALDSSGHAQTYIYMYIILYYCILYYVMLCYILYIIYYILYIIYYIYNILYILYIILYYILYIIYYILYTHTMLISMEGAPEHQRTAATNSSKNKEIHAIFCQAHAVAALQRLFFEALRNGQAGITSPRCWGLERFWGAFIPNTPNTPNTSERLSTVTLSSCHMTGTNLLRPQYVFFSMASWAVNGLWGCKWCSCRGTAATTGRVSQLRRDKSTGFTWFHHFAADFSRLCREG